MPESQKSILNNHLKMDYSLLRWFVPRYIMPNGIFIEFYSVIGEQKIY